jgi:hypothetical protein
VPGSLPGSSTPRVDHVFVVVEENHAYSQIIGSPDAPYWNFLASEGASLTDFHGLTHPSLPNYLALIGGSTFGLHDLQPTDVGCSFAAPLVVHEDAGWLARLLNHASPVPNVDAGRLSSTTICSSLRWHPPDSARYGPSDRS